MRIASGTALAVAGLLALTACGSSDDNDDAPATATVVGVVEATADLSTLVTAIDAAGLETTLDRDGPFTVFAPTNAAFEALPDGVLDALLLEENRTALVDVIAYHVLSGTFTSDQLTDSQRPTFEGSTVAVTTEGGLKVNGARVVEADLEAANGVVHTIDAVLVPEGVGIDSLLDEETEE